MSNEVIIVNQNEEGDTKVTVVEVVSGDPETVGEIIEAILDGTDSDGSTDDLPGVEHEHVVIAEQPVMVMDQAASADDEPESFLGMAPDAPTDIAGTSSASTDTGQASTVNADDSENQAHADAATEAQAKADEAVANGDYRSAEEFRETAENEAWQAGTTDTLHGSDSTELTAAADHQQDAQYYEQQEAQHAQAGDYEAARDDASNAAYATHSADYSAGGSDHSGQAQAEHAQQDWAVWEQGQADAAAKDSEAYAAQGDLEHAAQYAETAAGHQEAADNHGDLGEHGGDLAVHDPASDVADAGSYAQADASAGYSGYEDHSAASSYDAGAASAVADTTTTE